MFEVFFTVFNALMENSLFLDVVAASVILGCVLLILNFFGRGHLDG